LLLAVSKLIELLRAVIVLAHWPFAFP